MLHCLLDAPHCHLANHAPSGMCAPAPQRSFLPPRYVAVQFCSRVRAPCVHHTQASSTRCTVPMMCRSSGAVPCILYCHGVTHAVQAPCAMRTTSGGLNWAVHVYALRVCLGLHLRARASSGQECEAYKVRHRGVPAANSMQNASAYSALCSYHYIDASPGDILENEKIIRLAPNGPNSAERPSVYLRILNASKLAL